MSTIEVPGHRTIWRLAGPIILSNISTPLLGLVDTAVVGHLPDPTYIGGVALGSTLFSFLFWGFGFLRMGTTGFTSQAAGRGDEVEVLTAFIRPILLALVFGLGLVALQAPIALVSLPLFGASAEVEGAALAYYEIRIWSAPAALITYTALGWLLGTQRTLAVLVLEVLLNGINIALDLLFVLGFGWGIEGVAWATLIGEVVTALAACAYIFVLLRGVPRPTWAKILDRVHLLRMLHVNKDILIRTICLLAGFGVFTAVSARMGDITLAANQVLMQFVYFMAYAVDGFAHAAEILAGAALGARRRDVFRAAVVRSSQWALGFALIFSGAYIVAGDLIILTMTEITSVVTEARAYLWWVIALPALSVWAFQFDGIFVGALRTVAMRNAMLASLVVFLCAVWVLPDIWGNHGLWASLTIFMIARGISLGFYYPALERSVEA